jgi:hypothetical protein
MKNESKKENVEFKKVQFAKKLAKLELILNDWVISNLNVKMV